VWGDVFRRAEHDADATAVMPRRCAASWRRSSSILRRSRHGPDTRPPRRPHVLAYSRRTDLSPDSVRSLRAGLDLARPGGADVLLFHVVQRIPNLEDAEIERFYEVLSNTARDRMQQIVAQATVGTDVPVRVEVTIGRPASEILRVASERACDAIVLLHRADPEGQMLGSISYKLGILAPCSVLLLKT
jgi:nucleotide-binding universal stress UspA family protein